MSWDTLKQEESTVKLAVSIVVVEMTFIREAQDMSLQDAAEDECNKYGTATNVEEEKLIKEEDMSENLLACVHQPETTGALFSHSQLFSQQPKGVNYCR